MKKTSIGFAMTGSFCTFERVLKQMEALVRRGYEVVPVLSFNAGMLDTRFMTAEHLRARIVEITGNEPIDTLAGAEPIGPKKMTDVFLIAPATGNSLAKLAGGIYDTPALLGAKSHLRNDRPLVLAVSTNDGLGAAAQNIGRLLNVRNIYFVPFGQDDPVKKPRSLVADFSQIPRTIAAALSGVQMQPMLSYGAEGEAPTLH
ncbi:MAG: dipicolinate synthase subunit B [Christensenellales bacterium]|jgi:dipicolinic acid synthetase, B subunit|nr:dipicolinate synthase subunit B [Christensenellales bacterium]HIR80002.1 dipicolinate synthase subunit B [Candidatus Limiplasma merdipullorum]